MKSKHTPGPWKINTDWYHIDAPRGLTVAAVFGSTGPHAAESKANAKLIAAAPELLAACKAMLPIVDSHWDQGPPGEGWQSQALKDLIAFCEAAIEKAEN